MQRWWIALVLCLAAVTHVVAQETEPATRTSSQSLLVGVVVQGREITTIDVQVAGDSYLIPLADFAEFSGCTLAVDDTGARIDTPLGTVHLLPEDLRVSEGTTYIRDEIVEEKLATPVSFDASRYSMSFDLPWAPTSSESDPYRTREFLPDVDAPSASLSTLQADLRYTEVGESDYFRGMTTLGGRLGSGYWRMRYEGNLEGQRQLRDYAWLYRKNNRLLLAGHQRVRVHPLLRSVEFTGAQVATTNQSVDLFSRGPAPSQLLSRSMQPISTFEGFGPPAGVAELRVDGHVVERQGIGLDGRYEFVDVTIPARRATRIEVRLYDRHNPLVPIEIIEDTQTASEYLMTEGTWIHMGGAGVRGNAVQDQIDSRGGDGYAGFYQTRYGLGGGLTLEAAVQGTDETTQVMGGFVARLSRSFVTSLGLAASEGGFGFNAQVDGLQRPWRLRMRLQSEQEGFDPLYVEDQHDHYFELGHSRTPNLDVSVIGISRSNSFGDVNYLLPAVAWKPSQPLWLRARPDIDGNYRFDLMWKIDRKSRLNVATIEQRGLAQFWHELSRRHRLLAEVGVGGDLPNRGALIVTGFGSNRWRTSWMAGGLMTDGEPGYLVGGRIEPLPGIAVQARLESDSLVGAPDDRPESRFLLAVTADLGYSRGRIVAARSYTVREDRGGIAGAVRLDAPRGFRRFDLSGLPILLNGRRVATTDESGKFFIGSLKGGVYRVELGRDNLPIELTPQRTSFGVEVVGAAVTRVDFFVRPEFGIAGRVRDAAGQPAPGVRIELLDGSHAVIGRAVTDRFGLYRIDGLEIGRYMLRVPPDGAPGVGFDGPSRIVEIVDDFLFDQDLELPVVPGEETTGSRSDSG